VYVSECRKALTPIWEYAIKDNAKRTAAAAMSGAASRGVHHPVFDSEIWESGSLFIFNSLQEISLQSKMKPEDNPAQPDRRKARVGCKFAAVTLEFAALIFRVKKYISMLICSRRKGAID
jgi:hypothetical protein